MKAIYTLGIDVGSSSVKVSALEVSSGRCAASCTAPSSEMPIKALEPGWAEQDPAMWWKYVLEGVQTVGKSIDLGCVQAIGISYQMHGLVCLGADGKPLRDAIIWCDSRAVPYGAAAFEALGSQYCLEHLCGSPGNFTAAKLAWVKENEPELYSKIAHVMLPGDYIAYLLTGELCTTQGGLSEGALWDFKQGARADALLDFFGIRGELIPDIAPGIGIQARLSAQASGLTGLPEGIPVSYRAGDQPNNAFSLGVLEPGEVAATGGTSGVVYGVTAGPCADPLSRVNTFLHVNSYPGVLLCINGTGILNSWMHRNVAPGMSYDQMNELAAGVEPGSDGLRVYPFGNGAERVLQNACPGAGIKGLNLNRHGVPHLLRASQEGIAFAFKYGMDIMEGLGMNLKLIKAGKANLFLSPVFRSTLASVSGARIELYDTDGALGAARGAALGAGLYKNSAEAFTSMKCLGVTEPSLDLASAYESWKEGL